MLRTALLQLILLLFTCGSALAELPRLDLGTPTFTADGATVSLPLTLSNVAGVSLAAVGSTVRFDQTKLEYVSITAGPAATAAGKTASANPDPDNPSSVIIGVSGFNANSISDGVVATVTFQIKFAGGGTVITNAPSGADVDANDIVMAGTNGEVLVDTEVKLIIQGSGGGSVNSLPTGIHCTGGTCRAYYYWGAPVTLTALPDGVSTVTWSDACAGCAGQICNITATGGASCGVTFSPVKMTRIGGTDYDTLQAAYDAAATGAVIMAREYLFPDSLTCDLTKTVAIKGGYDRTYAVQSDYSTVTGRMTISKGSVTVDRVVIR